MNPNHRPSATPPGDDPQTASNTEFRILPQRRIQGGDIVIMEETARMAMFALVPAPLGGETSGTERFALTRRDDVIC